MCICLMFAGLKLSQCDFVAVNNGITVTKSCLQLNVINNHINARTACINGSEINQSCIMGNLFYKDPSSQGATVGVQISGNSAWNVIANNVSLLWLIMVSHACWLCLAFTVHTVDSQCFLMGLICRNAVIGNSHYCQLVVTASFRLVWRHHCALVAYYSS